MNSGDLYKLNKNSELFKIILFSNFQRFLSFPEFNSTILKTFVEIRESCINIQNICREDIETLFSMKIKRLCGACN